MNKTERDYQYELERIDDSKTDLSKSMKKWDEWRQKWHYYQQQESNLLEEINYFSRGTVSQRQSEQQLSYFDFEIQQNGRLFNSIDDGFSEEKRKLNNKENEIIEERSQMRKMEETNDEN